MYAFTNRFGQTQLQARIRMLNRPASVKTTWLKYPVFGLVVLTVLSTFARPQLKQLSVHLPKPLANGIRGALETTEADDASTSESKLVTEKLFGAVYSPQKSPASTNAQLTTGDQQPDTAYVSPSRYLLYQGNRLWWIMTPLFRDDDFVTVKNELARYGVLLQLIDVRYNQRSTFIEHLDYRLINTISGGSTGQKGNGKENTPTYASGGYLELETGPNQKRRARSTLTYAQIPATARSIPSEVRKIISEDEAIAFSLTKPEDSDPGHDVAASKTTQSLATEKLLQEMFMLFKEVTGVQATQNPKMEQLVQEGQRKYGHWGLAFRRFSKAAVQKQSGSGNYVTVRADGLLLLDDTAGETKVYVNNEPVSAERVRKLSIDQLYTVAAIPGYDEAKQKRSGVTYLLFYVEKDN